MTTGERIRQLRTSAGYTQTELGKMIGVTPQTVFKYEEGIVTNIPLDRIEAMAQIFSVEPAYIAGWDEELPSNAVPLKHRQIPVLGNVAAGHPIWADEEHDEYVDDNGSGSADFALRVKGDSMSPLIEDGDFVYVKRQAEVRNGQIAVVLDGDSATLKYVYIHGDRVQLISHNPAYPPMIYSGSDAEELKILGLAVAFKRSLVK